MYETWLVSVDKERIPINKIVRLAVHESVLEALRQAATDRGAPANDIQVLNLATGNWVSDAI
jgi:hypothetical protein